jgi:prolyl 4-hydroxylase
MKKNTNDFVEKYYIKKDICNDLILFFEKDKKTHQKVDISHIESEVTKNNKKFFPDLKLKKATEIFLNPDEKILENYLKELENCVKMYIKKYPWINFLSRWGIKEKIKIQRYEKNEAYFGWHSERTGSEPYVSRLLVFMTYLNDVDQGGETEWFYQKLKIKPKKGLTVLWPADFTHLHKGNLSKNKIKYIITGWYSLF